MAKLGLSVLGVLIAALVIVGSNAAFIVPETGYAAVFRFGEIKQTHLDAGLKFKAPFIETYRLIDKRNRNLAQKETEIIAKNQERLNVDAFARYRIVDPQQFYQRAQTESNGEAILSSQFDRSIRAVLGEVTVDEIISERRSELMDRIKSQFSGSAGPYGIEIIDVKILRADLPETNSNAVFQRMIAERNQLAQQYRSEGNEQANQIRAQADRQVVEIKAEAEEEAQKIRGKADGDRNAIFAAAYGKDPEFFAFYRSLLAYEAALQRGETKILLSPKSEFFRYFNSVEGKTVRE